jgi:hypothetical protein
MSAWPQLVSAALLGTGRREPPHDAPLAVERASAEAALLARAGTTAVVRRAGARPRTAPALPDPAPEETLPRCSERAGGLLAAILDGEFPSVLPEWLALVARRGERAPEELLPALLTIARGQERPIALDVLGQRGRWLARFHEDWAWAAGGEDTWETGGLSAREAWLRAARAADADAARAALEESWPREDPRERAVLLAQLQVGLAPTDEAFLEQALDDRRQEVRATATELLSALRGSELSARAAERAQPLLRLQRGLRTRLEAELPEALDDAAQRDVVHTKPPRGTGERAWWLRRLIALAPLELWERELGRAPKDLAGFPVRDDLEDAVRGGWTDAAAAQSNADWAEALLPRTLDPRLAEVVPRQAAEKILAGALDDPRAGAALARIAPYGPELSRAIVAHHRIDRGIAAALHPSVLDHLPDDAPPAAVRMLSFRHDLHQELA